MRVHIKYNKRQFPKTIQGFPTVTDDAGARNRFWCSQEMCVETQSVSKIIGDRFPKQQGRKANLLEGSRREEGDSGYIKENVQNLTKL